MLKTFTRAPWSGYNSITDNPTLDNSDYQNFSLDSLDVTNIVSLNSDINSVFVDNLNSDVFRSEVISVNTVNSYSDSSDYAAKWEFTAFTVSSDGVFEQLTVSDLSTADNNSIVDYLEQHYNNRLEDADLSFRLASGSIIGESFSSGGGGGDPYVKPLFGPKIRLSNSWKYCLLFSDPRSGLKVIGSCTKLDEKYISKLHKIKHNNICAVDRNDSYVRDWTYFNRCYVVRDDQIVGRLNLLNPRCSGKAIIELDEPKWRLYSMTHSKFYPMVNINNYLIPLADGDYIKIITDTYWDDLNYFEFVTSKTRKQCTAAGFSGELVIHSTKNRLAKI